MVPAQVQRIVAGVAHVRYLFCPQGSHMTL
jgi:hypothetical protein